MQGPPHLSCRFVFFFYVGESQSVGIYCLCLTSHPSLCEGICGLEVREGGWGLGRGWSVGLQLLETDTQAEGFHSQPKAPLRHSPLWRRGGSTQLCRVRSVLSSPPLSLSDYCRALYNTTPRISGLPGFSFVFCSPHDVFQRQTVSRFEPMLLSLPVRCAHACTWHCCTLLTLRLLTRREREKLRFGAEKLWTLPTRTAWL